MEPNNKDRDDLVILSSSKEKECIVCSKRFIPRVPSINVIEEGGKIRYVCSFQCRNEYLSRNVKTQQCSYCNKEFKPKYGFQTLQIKGGPLYHLCSVECQRSFIDEIKKEALKNSGINKMTDTTRKIVIFTQKGGTGKTTTAFNLSVALSQMGYKVLLIDGDPQGNISISFGMKIERQQKTLYHLFLENPNPEDLIIRKTKDLHLIVSDQSLAAVNITLAREIDPKNRHKVLSEKLEKIERHYDYVIMDSSPSLSVLNHNLLYAADEVLIPVACDYLSLAGLKQVMVTLDDVRKYFQHPIEVIGIVPTFYISLQRVSRLVVNQLRNEYRDLVLAPVRENARIRQSAFNNEPIVASKRNKNSAGYKDYHALADTITKRKRSKRAGSF